MRRIGVLFRVLARFFGFGVGRSFALAFAFFPFRFFEDSEHGKVARYVNIRPYGVDVSVRPLREYPPVVGDCRHLRGSTAFIYYLNGFAFYYSAVFFEIGYHYLVCVGRAVYYVLAARKYSRHAERKYKGHANKRRRRRSQRNSRRYSALAAAAKPVRQFSFGFGEFGKFLFGVFTLNFRNVRVFRGKFRRGNNTFFQSRRVESSRNGLLIGTELQKIKYRRADNQRSDYGQNDV